MTGWLLDLFFFFFLTMIKMVIGCDDWGIKHDKDGDWMWFTIVGGWFIWHCFKHMNRSDEAQDRRWQHRHFFPSKSQPPQPGFTWQPFVSVFKALRMTFQVLVVPLDIPLLHRWYYIYNYYNVHHIHLIFTAIWFKKTQPYRPYTKQSIFALNHSYSCRYL